MATNSSNPPSNEVPTNDIPTNEIPTNKTIMEDIISHFVNASIPSLDLPRNTGENQISCAGPRVHRSAMLTAMPIAAISNQLQVHQGASLPWPVTFTGAQ